MTRYWLIALPGTTSKDACWTRLNDKVTVEHEYAVNYRWRMPDLKVGTLDTLMSASESLLKLDQTCESLVHRMVQQLSGLLEKPADELYAKLLVAGVTLDTFIPSFEWDEAKYPSRWSIRELHEAIDRQVGQIDVELKTKMAAYSAVKGQLTTLDRKHTGNLLVRNPADFVHKDDLLLDSDYLQTLLVAVPKHLYKAWQNSYETVTSMVVPRSSKLIVEDDDYGLFSVIVFRKVAQDFKNLAKESRFVVKDFEYDEQELERAQQEHQSTEAELKNQWTFLIRWCRAYFSELFLGWMHVKMMRLFVESVLRYGLPPNFQALVMVPHRKTEKRLLEVLKQWQGDGFAAQRPTLGFHHTATRDTTATDSTSEPFTFVFLPIELEAR